jgi:hypothetical protein
LVQVPSAISVAGIRLPKIHKSYNVDSGQDPTKQVICASYGQDLSDKHAHDCRTLMMSDFYRALFPGTRLTTAQGFRMSTSVGGVLTGRGADIIILDDPLKPDDALSETSETPFSLHPTNPPLRDALSERGQGDSVGRSTPASDLDRATAWLTNELARTRTEVTGNNLI